MELMIFFAVQLIRFGLKRIDMFLPSGDRIFLVCPYSMEYGVPQLCDRFVAGEIGEHFRGPVRRRESDARPAHFIGLLVLAVFGHGLAEGSLVVRDALRIDAFQQIGIGGNDGQKCRVLLRQLNPFARLRGRREQEGFIRRQVVSQPGDRFVGIIDSYEIGPRFISFFDDQSDKLACLDVGADDQGLAGLHVGPDFDR